MKKNPFGLRWRKINGRGYKTRWFATEEKREHFAEALLEEGDIRELEVCEITEKE